ncbi:MAG TPA: recombinase family protein, partial [Bdellovibrionota bacterium]|nr:recombinase family protein [Bdellovibrionota bacterium]
MDCRLLISRAVSILAPCLALLTASPGFATSELERLAECDAAELARAIGEPASARARSLAEICYEGLRSEDPAEQSRAFGILKSKIRAMARDFASQHPAHTEDFIQDLAVAIMLKARDGSIQEPAHLFAYVGRAAINGTRSAAVNRKLQMERHAVRQRRADPEEDGTSIFEFIPDPDAGPSSRAAATGAVERILSHLSPVDREILVRKLVLGETSQEIEAQMGPPVTAWAIRRVLDHARKGAPEWLASGLRDPEATLPAILQRIADRGLISNPEILDIRIPELKAGGMSHREIADTLNDLGARTRSGKPWKASDVNTYLRNLALRQASEKPAARSRWLRSWRPSVEDLDIDGLLARCRQDPRDTRRLQDAVRAQIWAGRSYEQIAARLNEAGIRQPGNQHGRTMES